MIHTFGGCAVIGLCVIVPTAASACNPVRQHKVLELPGFGSDAQLVLPPAGVERKGVVVLFAGSDVADLDGTIVDDQKVAISHPLKQVADRLACSGFASFRYNKRYVTGAAEVDREKFDRLNGSDLAEDGRRAVALVQNDAQTRDLPLSLFGWSEGTTVAMAVAAAEPRVLAVALMAPVIESPAKNAQLQYARVGRPYLARFANNGELDAAAVDRAGSGPGGVLAQIFVRMFRGFRPGEKLNPMLDSNHDGRISFSEADPIIASWYADKPNGALGIAATGRALKGVADAYPGTKQPILLLQGANDSMVPESATRRFAASHLGDHRLTVKTYAGLGHSLGPAKSALSDGLGPIEQRPLADLATWLRRHLR